MKEKITVNIYTDGSSKGNPGPGGFGMVSFIHDNNTYPDYSISMPSKEDTTNNREELKAILYAMLNHGVNTNKYEFSQIEPPIVYSDSAYCVNTFNQWMFSWARNGWLKSDNKTPENMDLIQAYYDWYQKGYRIDLRKVKGHAGVKWNEMADKLATGVLKGANN